MLTYFLRGLCSLMGRHVMMEQVQVLYLSHHKDRYYHIHLFLVRNALTTLLNTTICGDSKLVINQLLALYEAKSDDLVPYFQYATQLMEKFEQISLVHIP